MFGSLDVSTSALVAQRTHLDVIAGNISMKDTVRFESGEYVPYRRRVPLFAAGQAGDPTKPGVHVAAIVEDPAPFGLRWDPDSPLAVRSGPQKGYVRSTNVDEHTEMVNALMVTRAYEANVSVIEATKAMTTAALRLIA
ncbi:MAG: flagellar basal body rod protein FlgC [Phycisphaerae bacterium]|nr:flagellar basal body rod protein FlgC [Phycisphaerae bacterium]